MRHEDMPKDCYATGHPAGSVKFKFTVGLFGGSCITEVIETNKLFTLDVEDMGAYLPDLLGDDGCTGDKYPGEPGHYLFDGHTYDCRSVEDREWHTPGRITLLAQLEESGDE